MAAIYVKRDRDAAFVKQVAEQLMAHDASTTHARDELGISELTNARPLQAAFASAATFEAMAMAMTPGVGALFGASG